MSCLQDKLKQAYLDGKLAAAVAELKQEELAFDAQQYLVDCVDKDCDTLIILAHGAGANMCHEFMADMANALSVDATVVRFNFPYMRANAIDGKRRPPDRAPKLIADYALQLSILKQQFKPKKVYLVGKSMGGRMSAILAESLKVDGVVCLGYPFIPLSGGEPRLEPIEKCLVPLMVIQGERDKFGHKGLVDTWPVMKSVQLHWLTDGDHSFKPRKSSGATLEANLGQAVSLIKDFI
ncbi:alpha/beta fold hydrolase [Shewanella schlegeliana]|uniref:Alpha/beta fold hydrolase n=1 Tax=Shewanella schlegeliana TaxID=190308 RepID=A0ABS1SYB4_9GAMM|nr:alpha/beta fold hydrolase [Shewanella schlegeliana]MBL4913528.1 alpha/beta fold hydrolase [Shewanella schlegeliana]MCL1108418.1 alpha/beta fold hydrolase [Shewanella schlegeliana]GIU28761.1 dienelactone hydrolase [Shewanella schlegeliana]